ncbi:MAG: hypothetical protein U5J64_08360 [Halobacteriales archaeon]|nr:hypothetical protein [Halobacteriales archaeon]
MELEKSGKFISRFKLDGEDPPHYYNIKKYYRYAKLSFLIIYVLIIPVSLIPEVIDVPYAAEFPLIIVIFIFVIGVIGILLLIADTLAYDITTNELVLHEFAVAVDAVEEGGDYKKCREHLKRARYLITKHDAKVFSDKRLSEVTEYISIISEADNYEPILEETFDEFYVRVLKPLYADTMIFE